MTPLENQFSVLLTCVHLYQDSRENNLKQGVFVLVHSFRCFGPCPIDPTPWTLEDRAELGNFNSCFILRKVHFRWECSLCFRNFSIWRLETLENHSLSMSEIFSHSITVVRTCHREDSSLISDREHRERKGLGTSNLHAPVSHFFSGSPTFRSFFPPALLVLPAQIQRCNTWAWLGGILYSNLKQKARLTKWYLNTGFKELVSWRFRGTWWVEESTRKRSKASAWQTTERTKMPLLFKSRKWGKRLTGDKVQKARTFLSCGVKKILWELWQSLYSILHFQ